MAALARDPRGAARQETWDPTKLFVDDDSLPTTQTALAQHFAEAKAERMARETTRDDSREVRVARGRSQRGDNPSATGMMGGSHWRAE